jgi:hypothetical protein
MTACIETLELLGLSGAVKPTIVELRIGIPGSDLHQRRKLQLGCVLASPRGRPEVTESSCAVREVVHDVLSSSGIQNQRNNRRAGAGAVTKIIVER